MKTKLLFSHYEPDSGISIVGMRNKYGYFEASACLHPEDIPYASSFFGCQVAEAKCMIKTHEERIRLINIKIKTLENFEKSLKNLKDYNPYSIECRKLRKQIYILKKEKDEILHTIQKIKQNIQTSETSRKRTLDMIQAKKNLDKTDKCILV